MILYKRKKLFVSIRPIVKLYLFTRWKLIADPATIRPRHKRQPIMWEDHMIMARNGITKATCIST